MMLDDERLEDLLAPLRERRQGAGLVELHQPAVADHVGGKDSGEAAFHSAGQSNNCAAISPKS